jgi:hypothetical protein
MNMKTSPLFAAFCVMGLATGVARADIPSVKLLKRGEGARLIKKAFPEIVKVRGAGVGGGQTMGVTANGSIELFEVNRETKAVQKLEGRMNEKILAEAKTGYRNAAKGATVKIGDAVGKADVISRSGQSVRVGFAFPKKSSKANFNARVAVSSANGNLRLYLGEDNADTAVATTRAIRALNKKQGRVAIDQRMTASTLRADKNTQLVAAAPRWTGSQQMDGRIMTVDRATGKITKLSGNRALEAVAKLGAFEQSRGHEMASSKRQLPSSTHQTLYFNVKWTKADAKGNQGRERGYDMIARKWSDSGRDGITTDR